MITIQSLEDLAELRKGVLPQALLRFVSELLEGLQVEAEPGEEAEYLLSHPLILCEPRDNVLELLNLQPMSLEYVERIELPGTFTFRAGVLLDNDWLALYIIPAVGQDKETLDWLKERCVGVSTHE